MYCQNCKITIPDADIIVSKKLKVAICPNCELPLLSATKEWHCCGGIVLAETQRCPFCGDKY